MIGMQIPAQHPYILHEDGRTVTAANPSRYFTVAAANSVGLCRAFIAFDQIFLIWMGDPQRVLGDVARMCDDAASKGVKLILSTILNRNAINVLGARTHADDAAAARALTTPGSAPWLMLERWHADIADRVGAHPGLFSIEVGNELAWLLDAVPMDTYLAFLDHFNAHLKQHGARATNGPGGKVASNYSALTDAQIQTYVAHLDYIDNHEYANDLVTSTAAEADAKAAAFEAFVARVRRVTGRPDLPVLYGEVGSLPDAYFHALAQRIRLNGWTPCFWVFDGDSGDAFSFNDAGLRPQVLPFLASIAAAAPVNTSPPVASGAIGPGGVVAASPGAWTQGPAEYRYQWQSSPDGAAWVDIAGAVAPVLSITRAHAGGFLRCNVTAVGDVTTGAAAPTNAVHVASLLLVAS